MKKFLIVLSIIPSMVIAQDISKSMVPSVVLNEFQTKFPGAWDIDWERQGQNYKAEFNIRFADNDVLLSPKGEVLKRKEDISRSSVPKLVKTAVKKEFPGYRIDDADKITEDNKIRYRLELQTLMSERNVVYSSDGQLLYDVED